MERGEPVGLAGDPGRGIPQIPDRVGLWASIAEDGSCLVTQTGHNRFGRVIGCLSVGYPSLSGLLGGLPGLRPVLYRNKLILVQADDPLPETLLENIAGAQLAAGTALSRDGYRISAIRLSGWTAELAVIVADPGWFERVSWIVLPAGAAALAVALLVLLVMALLARARRRRLEKIQDELDRLGGVGEQTATGVEALIRHAEMLERRDSPEGVEPDTVPVLAAVLGRDAAAPVPGTPPRPHDQELDVLINRVIGMDEPGTGADAGDDSGEREPGILGVEGLAGYWEMMRPIVRDTLRVGRCLLLSPDPAGTFRVVERVNTDPRLDAAFVIRPSDGLFQRILGKKKVLFLKERVMESRVIAALLPGEDAESVHQMAIIPVVAQDGGIGGMLVMLKSVGEVPFDVYALYETMYLSIL
jgi:hypothetical protein